MITCRNEDEVLQVAAKIRESREYYEKSAAVDQCGSATGGMLAVGISNDDIVRYHNPTPVQIERIKPIRAAARLFLDAIDEYCGHCADATAAKRKVREAMMTANAAIVLNGMV